MRGGLSRCALLVLAALLFVGCVPKLERPTLSVVGVQLLSGNLWEQRLKVRLRVQNPNDRALPVKSIEYTLEVADQPFASGESADAFTVPALGETEFDMNVTTNVTGTLLKLLARGSERQAQDVPYRLSGKLSLSAGLLRSIPFEEQGTFSLQ
jgi:LEA14-like dessication related protein